MACQPRRRWRGGLPGALGLLTCGLVGVAIGSEPLVIDHEEHVDVQLVLVDAVVLDERERTVPGLGLDDFALRVDGRPVELATLDVNCPLGGVADPRAGQPLSRLAGRDVEPVEPRRIVLVFDYYHMDWAIESLGYARRAIDEHALGDEEHMVVALSEMVILQTPFTRDTEEVRQALDRMSQDVRLYGGNYGRLTERRFFERMQTLFDVLEQMPGRKMVVLFSGPFLPDGFFYDPQIKKMGALSTTARTAIYPVDSRGMTNGFALEDGIGGPEILRRLANETGGRMTANTNDLALAYARAQRDFGCTYTLGFYDRAPRPDNNRRLSVRVDRRGHRVLFSQSYVVRSQKRQRRSLMRTATMAPGLFEDPGVRGTVFLVGTHSERHWEAALAVELHPTVDQLWPDDRPWHVRAVVRKPWGTVVKSVRRELKVAAFAPGVTSVDPVSFVEPLRLRPGRYSLNVVAAHPLADRPLTGSLELTVPPVPDDRLADRLPIDLGPGDERIESYGDPAAGLDDPQAALGPGD